MWCCIVQVPDDLDNNGARDGPQFSLYRGAASTLKSSGSALKAIYDSDSAGDAAALRSTSRSEMQGQEPAAALQCNKQYVMLLAAAKSAGDSHSHHRAASLLLVTHPTAIHLMNALESACGARHALLERLGDDRLERAPPPRAATRITKTALGCIAPVFLSAAVFKGNSTIRRNAVENGPAMNDE